MKLTRCLHVWLAIVALLLAPYSASIGTGVSADWVGGASQQSLDTASIDPSDSSTACNTTSACVPCTEQQKATDTSCRATGYRQAIHCIEHFMDPAAAGERTQGGASAQGAGTGAGEAQDTDEREGVTPVGRRGLVSQSPGSQRVSSLLAGLLPLEEEPKEARQAGAGATGGGPTQGTQGLRHLLTLTAGATAGQLRRFDTFQSCTPEAADTLSVLGFEGLVLAVLALCAPIVYHRKKRSAAPPNMARIPSSARF